MVSSTYFHNNNRFAQGLSINEHKLMLDVGIVEKNRNIFNTSQYFVLIFLMMKEFPFLFLA
jgi:glutamine cyclotransferase